VAQAIIAQNVHNAWFAHKSPESIASLVAVPDHRLPQLLANFESIGHG
jgi:hypothetical protein